jgi:hypothetical protein
MKRLVPLVSLALLLASASFATPANNCLYFDADARVTGLSGVSPTAFTVEFWIDLDYSGGLYQGVYWSNNGLDERGIYVEYDHTISIYDQNTNVINSAFPLPLHTWTHVAFVYDGTTMKIYFNAVLKCTTILAGIQLPTTNVLMGYSASGVWGDYDMANSALDEFRIWNSALSQTTLLNNKAHTLTLPQAGLLRYYTFNQGVGGSNNSAFTTLPEVTGNGTSGILTGFTLNGTTSNWIGNTPFTLPLELLSFKAVTTGSEIKTSWTTANENQVSKFEVERSDDGSSFEKIGTLVAQNSQANSYEWIDANPLSGNNYYRLSMVDIDGASTYSKVVVAGIATNTKAVKIYAGATAARAFTVEVGSEAPKGNYNVGVYNMSGAMIYRRQWQQSGSASTQAIVLPSTVTAGVYTIIVNNGTQRFTQKWVVE